jgi:hypothetical protein
MISRVRGRPAYTAIEGWISNFGEAIVEEAGRLVESDCAGLEHEHTALLAEVFDSSTLARQQHVPFGPQD